jgi:hypothetical protein
MAQLQKVSWRAAGYAALGTAVAVASVVAIVNSDGVRPTSLTSSSATRWLVDQVHKRLVLVDGLAGNVVAKINTGTESADEVAVQGAGGAFLINPTQASVRTISTAKLQLGTAQTVGALSEKKVEYRVGDSGLTVVNSSTSEASVLAVDDVNRKIKIPGSTSSLVAGDGSLWLFTATEAKHVNIDESTTTVPLRSRPNQAITVGARAVAYDANHSVVRWIDGADVPVDIPNASEAVLQEPGDDAPCVWLGAGDMLECVGATSIDHKVEIPDLNIGSGDRLAIAGSAAVVVGERNKITRIDLENRRIDTSSDALVRDGAPSVMITASGDLVWLDDRSGENAWVVHRFGINIIDKNSFAPVVDAQGQVVKEASTDGSLPEPGAGNAAGDQPKPRPPDNSGKDDPPHAVDDSVTARAGTTVTIPVTANDWDPEGQAIAVDKVGTVNPAGHGTTDVLNGSSVTYIPEKGFSGSDSFSYTIVDETGHSATGTVNVQLFPVDSTNRPPIARPDRVKTRIGRAITIDVLANDVDPERDLLTIPTFGQTGDATITDAKGPSGLPALRYTPPPGRAGTFTFTYRAADPQGATSPTTEVTVEVTSPDADNAPPVAVPDAMRLRVGTSDTLDVKANDTDPDGDDLTISVIKPVPAGLKVVLLGQQLHITLQPGAQNLSTVLYSLTDGRPGHETTGHVLVMRIRDTTANRRPVANPDAERVVIGNSVRIPVTANDIDPDADPITLLSVDKPAGGVGTTTVEGNSVRFKPTMPDITEPTPVSFAYTITDGNGNDATGQVTVTVLAEALPRAPFARDDFADTVTDKPVNIDVLANDSDPSGGGPPILVGDPTCINGGIAKKTDDQRVSFTPPLNGVGTYRCIYKVINSQKLGAQASIVITVTSAPPGNHDPVMNTDPLHQDVVIGKSATFNANDIAHDDDSGDSLVFASVSKPEHGTTSFSGKAASFTYNAPPTGSADRTPVSDNLDVTISDGHDGNVRGTIAIRLIDDTPAVVTVPSVHDMLLAATVDQPASLDVLADLRVANNGAPLNLVGASADAPTPSATVTYGGGTVVVTAKASGTLSVSYTVANAELQRATGKIKVIISDPPVVNPPPIAVADELTIPSGGIGTVDLLANDQNIGDPGDVPTATLVNRPPASFGTVGVNNNGVLTLTAAPGPAGGTAEIHYELADGSGQTSRASVFLTILACVASPPEARAARLFTPYQTPIDIDLRQYASGTVIPSSVTGAGLTGAVGTYTPPPGMNGTELVNYDVTNGCGQIAHGTLTIDVNRAPIGGNLAYNLSRGDSLNLAATDLASDDEALRIQGLTGNPSWVSLVPITGAPGAFSQTVLNASPPGNVVSGTYRFTVTVEDPGGLTATTAVTLVISNIAPTAVADAYTTEFSQYTFDPTLNDFDSEPGPLDVQIVTPLGGPATVLGRTGNVITVSLPHGVSTFSYTIRDSGGLTSSSTITITSNQAPSAPDISDTTNQPTIDLSLSPTDPDGDSLDVSCGSTSVFDVVVIPDPNPSSSANANRVRLHVTVLLNPSTGTSFTGTSSFTCTTTDPFGATAISTVTLTIVD